MKAKTMKAIQLKAPGAGFELVHIPAPEPGDGEVLIAVEACGVCHGDALVLDGHYQGLKYPIIPGHEVIGKVVAVGNGADEGLVGSRVGVGWHGGHCFRCKACNRGDFWACEHTETTGITRDGGYAEFMTAREQVLVDIPEDLDSVEAAPLLCAGRTTFGALKNSGARGGDLVAIHGLGGLGHLAVQYAAKLGFRVAVISHSQEKEELARHLGAHYFLDSGKVDVAKHLMLLGGAKVVLCTAPNATEISKLVNGLARGGELVIVTGTNEALHVPAFQLLGGGKSVTGWVGGNADEAVAFSVLTKVVPMVEIFPLEEAREAFQRMMDSQVHFRAVLTMK